MSVAQDFRYWRAQWRSLDERSYSVHSKKSVVDIHEGLAAGAARTSVALALMKKATVRKRSKMLEGREMGDVGKWSGWIASPQPSGGRDLVSNSVTEVSRWAGGLCAL